LKRLLLPLTALMLALLPSLPADAAMRTETKRSKVFDLGGFQTIETGTPVPAPKKNGKITRMTARVVHVGGGRVSVHHVMLHHVVFINNSARVLPGDESACSRRKGEKFWGTGEETQRLILPRGYGYPVRRGDDWRMGVMLMSHSIDRHRVRIEYTYKIATGKTARRMTRVKPFWLHANGCGSASYNVPGHGDPGSLHRESYEWPVPMTGRIVAAGAHTHAGNVRFDITQPHCGDRTLVEHDPRFGLPEDTVYNVRPLLHEPGPISTGYFLSRTGIPIRRGETIRTTSLYEGEWPRAAVMAISHVYVAPGVKPAEACPPLPSDRFTFWTRKDGRPSAPRMAIPFSAWDAKAQRTRTVDRPAGPIVDGGSDARVAVRDTGFAPANLTLDRGGSVTWDWTGRDEHNLWYADGPLVIGTMNASRGFSLKRTLSRPGTYRYFCYLHPLTMQQRIDVR